MFKEIRPQASEPADTGRSAPSTLTVLQTVQTGGYDNALQAAASNGADHNSQCVDSFFYPGYYQLHAWNQGQYNDGAAIMLPVVLVPGNHFRADQFGEGLSNLPSGSASIFSPPLAPPPAFHHQGSSLGERKTSKQPQKKEVYIKKPLNAFMLFMKEQRPTVSPAIRWKGSGVVNAFLATVWKSMSAKEQEKYYLAAEKERLLHQQQYPGWSNKDNYGKMRTKAKRGNHI